MEKKENKNMKTESLTQQVAKNSLWNFTATLISRIGGLIFTIILARFLLPEGFGIYSLAMSVALIFLTFADLGINNVSIRYISNSLSQKNIKRASAYFYYILKIKLFLIISLAFLLAALSYPLSNFIFHKPSLVSPLLFSSFYLVVLGLEGFYSSLFFAFNKVKYVAYKEAFFQVVRLIFIATFFLLIAKTYHVLGAIFSLIFSTFLLLLLVCFWLKKLNPKIFKKYNFKIDKKKLFGFISYLAIGSLSVVFFSNIDAIMLGIFIPDTSYVGFYKAAFSLVTSIAGLLTFASVLLPVFSKVTKKRLNSTFNKIIKYTNILSFPTAFGLVILGKYFIRLIYGYDYLSATFPLYILAFVIIETTITGNYYAILTSKGRPDLYAKMLGYAALLNVVFNFIFIYTFLKISFIWAMTGAAIATFLSRYFYLISIVYISKKNFNLKINRSYILKPLLASVIMSILLFIINLSIKDMTLLTGVLEVLLGIVIYFAFLVLIKGVTKEDFRLIKNLFSRY